jgi:chromosomal replication initiator protein
MVTKGLWKDILASLAERYSRPNFVTWLKPTQLIEEGEGLLSISVPNEYSKTWIEREALKDIRSLLEPHYPVITNLRVIVTQPIEKEVDLPLLQQPEKEEVAEEEPKTAPQPKEFNPRHTCR